MHEQLEQKTPDISKQAKETYDALVGLINLFVHDIVCYRNSVVEEFTAAFKANPLDTDVVQSFVRTYVPERSRFRENTSLNVDLEKISEFQNKILVMHKLGFKNASLSELSEDELKLLAAIPSFLPHVKQMQQEKQSSQKTCLSIVINCIYSFFADTNSKSKNSNTNTSNIKATTSSISYHSHQQ